MRSATMTNLYGDKERDFLDALEADTGRSLTQWMEAISAQGLKERNDVIDWLRGQGFRFSRASWLERVHHNGGKPIYAGRPPVEHAAERRTPRPAARPRGEPSVLGSPRMAPQSVPPRSAAPATAMPLAPRAAGAAYASAAANVVPLAFADPLSPQITEVTAKAKAYRPLADYLLREIAKAVPGVTFAARGQSIAVANTREFATLAVSPRELKLALAGGGSVSLTDARQVDGELLDAIRAAASRP
jgi:hypothetical protein